MMNFDFKCFKSFEFIDFMFNFEYSNFTDLKFKHFIHFNFVMSMVNYFEDYFAMVMLISSKFMWFNLYYWLRQ